MSDIKKIDLCIKLNRNKAKRMKEECNIDESDYCNQIADYLEDLKCLRAIHKQIRFERDVAVSQLEELGGQLGEKPELIKYRIYSKAIDEIIKFIDETDKSGIDYEFERNSNAIYFNGFDERETEIYNFVCGLKEFGNMKGE